MCSEASAQVYGKLNALYALGGVINPAVEIGISRHSTFQTEFVVSPWRYVRDNGINKPMLFVIFSNEYRYYFREKNNGWYAGANAGMMAFNMTKPHFGSGGGILKNSSSKGYGFMVGITGGYQWQLSDRWLMDAFVGFGYMNSNYNGYSLVDGLVEGGVIYNKGEIIMTPHRSEELEHPDPFNGSSEWLPNKIGVSFGYKLFDPKRSKKSRL